MDNPQHYQPLSHALHPPLATKSQPKSGYGMYDPADDLPSSSAPRIHNHREEEEEEEEDDDDDEDDDDEDDVGLVEEQLHENPPSRIQMGGSRPTTEDRSTTRTANGTLRSPPHTLASKPSEHEPDYSSGKRRPGRPRGSKNRKPRSSAGDASQKPVFYAYNPTQGQHQHQHQHQQHQQQHHHQQQQPQQHQQQHQQQHHAQRTGIGTVPPAVQNPDVNAQNQQYYEFQWRVLNLCAEFYGAAEELVKATPPLVLAQCYHVGPSSKVDPIIMLGEAKRICDTLLANPARLIAAPPPPLRPVLPTFGHQPTPSTSTKPSAPTPPSSNPSAVITNPQSFVVPLSSQQPPPPTNPNFPPPHYYQQTSYPTTPYYSYPGYLPPGATYYPPMASQAQHQPQPQPPQPLPLPPPPPKQALAGPTLVTLGTGAALPGVNQGSWSEEETGRLKKLAEQSKSIGSSGEIEWDWVVRQWGSGRTRHQILIKATSLGLKESSSRGVKRRRDTESGGQGEGGSPIPGPRPSSSSAAAGTSAGPLSGLSGSPSMSHTTSPPAASPAIHQQRIPSSSKGHSSTPGVSPLPPPLPPLPPVSAATTSNLPWPMPTVAANTPSPVIGSGSGLPGGEPQRTSYYRALSSQSEKEMGSKAGGRRSAGGGGPPTYIYHQPNGGSRLGKENGR